jgi:hypothetical protein
MAEASSHVRWRRLREAGGSGWRERLGHESGLELSEVEDLGILRCFKQNSRKPSCVERPTSSVDLAIVIGFAKWGK